MEEWGELLGAAGQLGQSWLAVFAIAGGLIVVSKQIISMRRDLLKTKVESVNALLKIWSDLHSKKRVSDDPEYAAIRRQILKQFDINLTGKPSAIDAPLDAALIAPQRLGLVDCLLFGLLGGIAAQVLRLAIVQPHFLHDLTIARFTLALLLLLGFSGLSALLALFILGAAGSRRTYFLTALLAGLAIPLLVWAAVKSLWLNPT